MNKYEKRHRHRAVTTRTTGFTGPVSMNENRAAHGNICDHETCSCGAQRRVNINGIHIEKSEWSNPDLINHDANGRLIRAAPDMAKALRRFARAMEQKSYPELQGITCEVFEVLRRIDGEQS